MPGLVEGAVVVITGAARGTGAVTAELLVAEGAAAVCIVDVREEEGAAVALRLGPVASFHAMDITDTEAWSRLCSAVADRHGRIDVLVNNAAVLHLGTLEHTSIDVFRRVLDVNVAGTFAGIAAVVPAMRSGGGGSIVNVASVDALQGMNGVSAYAASKWAVRGLTKSLALELGRDAIRVNAVCPAGGNMAMYAPWAEQLMDVGDHTGAYIADRAIPREARLDEIAQAVVWLASPRSGFVTGADLPVDGGATAGAFLAPFNDI